MKKILFLMQLPPPYHGASMVNNYIFSNQLFREKFKLDFINISPAEDMNKIGEFSVKKMFKSFGIIYRSIKTRLIFKPDLIYITLSPHGPAFIKDSILVLIHKFLRTEICIHMHGKGIKNEIENSKIKKIYYKIVFNNTKVIHLSEKLVHDLDDLVKKDDIYIVNNGVSDLKNVNKKYSNEKLHFLYLSNFVPEKGAHLILDALRHIKKDNHHLFKLTLVGKFTDFKYKEQLLNKIKEYKNLEIDLHEGIYGDNKNIILNNCDIFILPTYFKNECFPLSILEAMSAESAIISTNEGAITDFVINNKNGFIAKRKCPEDLAKVMTKMIASKETVNKFKVESRNLYLKKYTDKIFRKKLIFTLNNILSSKKNV